LKIEDSFFMVGKLQKKEWAVNGIAFIFFIMCCMVLNELLVPPYDKVMGNIIGGTKTEQIVPGKVFAQPFIAVKGNLSEVQVQFFKEDIPYPEHANISWELVSNSGSDEKVLAQGSIPVSDLSNGGFCTISFNRIRNSFLKAYQIRFSTSSQFRGISFGSSNLPLSVSLAYTINGQKYPGTFLFSTGFVAENFDAPLFFKELGIAFILWLLFISHKKWTKFLTEKPVYLTVSLAIALAGLIFIAIEPPLHMFDEPEHFRRVWEVSSGKLMPTVSDGVTTTYLPEYIQHTYERIYRSASGTTQNPAQLVEMLFEPGGDEAARSSRGGMASAYSFLAYLLPALFVRVGIWLGSSAFGLMVLARLANLVQFVFLTGWALKQAQVGKNTIAVMAMLGLVVTQGTAINVDSLMVGGSFLFLASVFNLAYSDPQNTPISFKDVLPILVGSLSILISKHIYIPILALVLIIPVTKFGSKRKKVTWIGVFWLAAGIIALILQTFVTPGKDPRIDYSHINLMDQLRYILSSPMNWPRVFANAVFTQSLKFYNQFNLLNGTEDTSLGIFGLVQSVAVLLFAWSGSDDVSQKMKTWHKWLILLVMIAASMFVMVSLYLFWTPVGDPNIVGLQGRYFIPIITLGLITFKPAFIDLKKVRRPIELILVMGFLLFVQMWIAVQLFY
jgi:uncharacterized membrane protein